MREIGLSLASMALALLLVGGVAWAVVVDCSAEYCYGTTKADTLNGRDVRDKMYGKGGDDLLLGNGGNDRLDGQKGNDTMRGGEGNEVIRGKPGVDKLYGEDGNDRLDDVSASDPGTTDPNVLSGGKGDDFLWGSTRLYGGPGDDDIRVVIPYFYDMPIETFVNAGPGIDTIFAKGSRDTIDLKDGEHDTVTCGGRNDTVFFDEGIDTVDPDTCENLNPEQ